MDSEEKELLIAEIMRLATAICKIGEATEDIDLDILIRSGSYLNTMVNLREVKRTEVAQIRNLGLRDQ